MDALYRKKGKDICIYNVRIRVCVHAGVEKCERL